MTPTRVDAMHYLEKVPLRFPFTKEMAAGVTIVSVTPSIAVVSGEDPNPASLLVGTPLVSAGEAFQLIQGQIGGVEYLVMMVATLSNGLKLVRASILPVITFQ